MKKRNVCEFLNWKHEKTAEYIVAHARYQRSRGRKPSECYRGRRNPQKALALAMDELQKYYPPCGEHIETTAQKMVRISSLTNQCVLAYFNDIAVKAVPTSTAESIVAEWRVSSETRHAEWLVSDTGIAYVAEREAHLQSAQNKVVELAAHLPDFTDLLSVVDWLADLQDPSDHRGVDIPWQEIVDIFATYGFLPNMNTGHEFNAEDEDNFARWLIGQALGGLVLERVHAIHQVYYKFAQEWREKFGHTDPAS